MTTIAEHLRTASDAVRAANHASYDGPTTATDAYDVVGVLDEIVHRLPQLVGHLARSLNRADPADHFDDRGCDPLPTLHDSASALQAVRGGLDSLGVLTDNVHNHLAHLGRYITEDD